MEITTTNDEPLAVIAEDVVDGFGSFLKVVKLHDDVSRSRIMYAAFIECLNLLSDQMWTNLLRL